MPEFQRVSDQDRVYPRSNAQWNHGLDTMTRVQEGMEKIQRDKVNSVT